MTPGKKRMSKFDRVALEIAEGIANIPIEGKEEAEKLLQEIESKKEAPRRAKALSSKIRTEVKKKSAKKKR
jgi:hypothetical protein